MTRKKTERIISLIMAVVMLVNTSLTAFAENHGNNITYGSSNYSEEFKYVVQTEEFDIQAGSTNIKGEIIEKNELPDLHDGLLEMMAGTAQVAESNYVGGNEIKNENNLYSKDGYTIGAGTIELTNTIIAENDITLNASNINGSGILYSKNQNIVINANKMNFSGILYAPNGTIYLNGTDVILDGSIIAKRVVVRAGSFSLTQNDGICSAIDTLEYIRTDQIIGLFFYYSEEDDEIVLQWDGDEEILSVDVYTRYGDGDFKKIATAMDDEYRFPSAVLSGSADFGVIAHTKYGETISSTIVTLVKDEEGIYETVIDSDGDGIPDAYEVIIETDPYNTDTDGDGFLDAYELLVLHTDPLVYDQDFDFDEDGLTNQQEMERGTNPNLPDSDFDGINDGNDRLPMKADANSNREVSYNIPVRYGYFDLVTRYISGDGKRCEFSYNYLNGQIRYLCSGENRSYNIYDQNNQLTAAIEWVDGKIIANTYTYNNGNIETITHSGTQYSFSYTDSGQLVKAMVGNRTLIEYGYSGEQLVSEGYGNGAASEYLYNEAGCIIAQLVNGALAYEWTYDEEGNVISFSDLSGEIVYSYGYDEEGYITKISSNDGFEICYNNTEDAYAVKYMLDGEIKEQTSTFSENEDTEGVPEGWTTTSLISDGKLVSMTTGDGITENTIYSNNKQIVNTKYYSSDDGVTKVEYQDGRVLEYMYDENGNITSIQENGEEKVSYVYDGLGQLIRENSLYADKTIVYTYDNAGNLLRCDEYEYTDGALGEVVFTKKYKYEDREWRDLLTEFNGQKIIYDEIGNPLSYRNGISFSWSGRQLTSMQTEESNVLYTYDHSGIRQTKTVDGVETIYHLEGTKIVAETTKDVTKWYIYDDNDTVIGFEQEGQTYYFEKNAQNDVVRILDGNGNVVCEYLYDAWGNITSILGDREIADANPFRYRSYYYDEESGFYYLQSRYYDPYTGRFLNADEITYFGISGTLLGYNQFAYCINNPVKYFDPTGHYATQLNIPAYIISSLSGALAGIIAGINSSIVSLKAAIAASWIPAVCIAAAAIAIVGVVHTVNKVVSLMASAEKTIAYVKAKVKAGGLSEKSLKNHTVYVIVEISTNKVVYAGRTCKFLAFVLNFP